MLDLILSLFRISDTVIRHYTQSNANHCAADQSKTQLNIPFQTEIKLSIDLNRNFVFRLSLNLILVYFQFLFFSRDCST